MGSVRGSAGGLQADPRRFLKRRFGNPSGALGNRSGVARNGEKADAMLALGAGARMLDAMEKPKSKGGALEWCNEHLLPNCRSAMRLADLGTDRELTGSERLALRYHRQLCLFCACNALPFELKLKAMHAAEAERRQGGRQPTAKESSDAATDARAP